MLHGVIAVIMIAVILAHIYIGTIGMQGAFWSMGNGKVDTNWAKQHHSIWADRVVPKDDGEQADAGGIVPSRQTSTAPIAAVTSRSRASPGKTGDSDARILLAVAAAFVLAGIASFVLETRAVVERQGQHDQRRARRFRQGRRQPARSPH